VRETPTQHGGACNVIRFASRPRGCQIVAAQSGHAVPVDQPEVVVNAIRAIVDTARGRDDVSLCGSRVRSSVGDSQNRSTRRQTADAPGFSEAERQAAMRLPGTGRRQ
jgi:hypothetical protein